MPILLIAIPLEAGEDPTRDIAPLLKTKAPILRSSSAHGGCGVPAPFSTAASDPRVS